MRIFTLVEVFVLVEVGDGVIDIRRVAFALEVLSTKSGRWDHRKLQTFNP